VEYENESDPWVPSKAEASRRNLTEFNELTQSFTGDDLEEEEGTKQRIFSNSTKASKRNVYMEYLIWIRQLKRDPIPKKIMETWDVFVNDDNFDQEGIRDCHW
jgi:hypothetical protein